MTDEEAKALEAWNARRSERLKKAAWELAEEMKGVSIGSMSDEEIERFQERVAEIITKDSLYQVMSDPFPLKLADPYGRGLADEF